MKRKDFILISALIMAGAPLTGKAQLSKSALDYMLQRPQVTKSYKDKKFMDHLFMDFGSEAISWAATTSSWVPSPRWAWATGSRPNME